MSRRTGQSVVVDNRPGAEGQIGAQAAATAAPDGYTIFGTTQTTQAINQHVYKTLPYDPVKSFAPISGLSSGAQIVMVRKDLPVKTIPELIALARAQPGKLTFGSGNGSARGAAELFRIMAKVDLLGVPYKTQPQVIADLLGGPDRHDLQRLHRGPAAGAGRPGSRSRGDQSPSAIPGSSNSRRSPRAACPATSCVPGMPPTRRPARRGRS